MSAGLNAVADKLRASNKLSEVYNPPDVDQTKQALTERRAMLLKFNGLIDSDSGSYTTPPTVESTSRHPNNEGGRHASSIRRPAGLQRGCPRVSLITAVLVFWFSDPNGKEGSNHERIHPPFAKASELCPCKGVHVRRARVVPLCQRPILKATRSPNTLIGTTVWLR